jgi:Laminin G domain
VKFPDFISLELERGQPRLLIDFGSGTLELKVKTKKGLDDGEWHRLDVFWDTEVRKPTILSLRTTN